MDFCSNDFSDISQLYLLWKLSETFLLDAIFFEKWDPFKR